jgi:hypothetical protein
MCSSVSSVNPPMCLPSMTPAARFVGDFQTFADAGEHHRMVTDDIAAAQGGETDGARITLAGDALAAINGAGIQVTPQCVGDDFAHPQRGAGRRIDLVPVMRFDNLDIELVIQHARRHVQQLQRQIDADTHVGREHDGNLLAACSIAALPAASKPVVPMISPTLRSTQTSR